MKRLFLLLSLLLALPAIAADPQILLDKTPTAQPIPADAVALKFDPVLGRLEAQNSDGTNAPFGAPSVTEATPVNGVKATATIDPTGTNNNVLYTAVGAGIRYNTISIRYVISGSGSAVLSVATASSVITVTAGSATTAQSVITAVNADATAASYVLATASGTVTSAIAATGPTALSGGIDCTPAKRGELRFDGNTLYVATVPMTITSTSGWKRLVLVAL